VDDHYALYDSDRPGTTDQFSDPRVFSLPPTALHLHRHRLSQRVPVQTRSPNSSSRLLPQTIFTVSTPRRSKDLRRSVWLSWLDRRSLPSPTPIPTPPFIKLQVTPKSWSTMMEGTNEMMLSPLVMPYKKDYPVLIISIRARHHSRTKMIMKTMRRRVHLMTLNQSARLIVIP
jgi:hypothetical protein